MMWEVAEQSQRYGPLSRPLLARYGGAAVLSLAALIGARLLFPLADRPVYSLLLGAAAVAIWYGGFGPGLLAIAIGWSFSPFLLLAEGDSPGLHDEDDLFSWGVPLAVAVVVMWVSVIMRRGQQRAATAAAAAEESTRHMDTLRQIATALSAALTPKDVAHALIDKTPSLLGARGGSVGLVDGDELVIVDPANVRAQTHRPGLRLPLWTRAPITTAASQGELVVARDRDEFLQRFPDGAALSPFAHAAIAVPIRVAGEVVGSMSFLFERAVEGDEEAVAITLIAGDLGGQALERAQLYERETHSRRALDRILRIAPRLHAETSADAAAAICREARTTFGSDLAELWQLDDAELLLEWREPRDESTTENEPIALGDMPGARRAVEQLEVTFVAELASSSNAVSEYIARLGVHAFVLIPIVVGGHAERVLLLSWRTAVSEPDASTIAVARRFADQAALAVEQLHRRRAQAEAARRAERTRRLQEATGALSQAARAVDVGDTCLEHALATLGADAGLVARVHPDGDRLDVVSAHGYGDEWLERSRVLRLDAGLPLTQAHVTGEPVWALDAESAERYRDVFSGEPAEHRAWLALPLIEPSGAGGALQLAFRTPQSFADEDREWIEALAFQCAQAFVRSRLLEEERRLRQRSERLQSMTASLSGSVTQRDVAEVAVAEIIEAVGASGAGLAVVHEERRLVSTLSYHGYDHDIVEPLLEASLDARTPGNRAIRRRTTAFYETADEIAHEYPDAARELAATGHRSFAFVPLVAAGTAKGLVVASWMQQRVMAAEERVFLESLASQTAQALDRARHFESERTIAETLQRSVLPVSLPNVDGVELAARYLPGTAEVEVGGDWFDAISLPNGRLGIAVGDVVGKGVQSAATMAQLRNALRAFALDQMKPSSTMSRLNRLAQELPESAFATIVYAVVDPVSRTCRFTSAGHPPPLVVYPDGKAQFLEGGRSVPLGTAPDTTYPQDIVELPFGSTLILYTDGLIERRGESIDDSLRRLREAALAASPDPEGQVEHILAELVGHGERRDDIAVLAMRLLGAGSQPLHLRLPSQLHSLDLVREALRLWLERAPASEADTQEIILATWEACANAVEHAHDPVEDFFSVDATIDDHTIRVTVLDSGVWIPVTERADRGLGLKLIRSLMSSVDIETGHGGTRITLEKTLARDSTVRSGA
jgi:serine phosphatase RsbU (regulator of sigma subunit)/anti-sigma regulatory factor (Ser/Thr protein kinase)